MKPSVLIIGSNGLLGQKVVDVFKEQYVIHTAGIETEAIRDFGFAYYPLDITNKHDVITLVDRIHPDVILNAAAYTQVDQAEIEKEKCFAVNATGVRNLAEACRIQESTLVHISTDYVFDGKKGNYDETDKTNPLSYYGFSKLEGERAVWESGCDAIVARTAVLFGAGIHIQMNFPLWVYRELAANRTIRVVDDQIGNPTIADNLATAILEMLEKKAIGLFHVAGRQPVSRYEFAIQIAEQFKFDPNRIFRIKSKDFPQRAARPMDVSLNVQKIQRMFTLQLFNIKKSLAKLEETMKT